jgi:hypothetical protein
VKRHDRREPRSAQLPASASVATASACRPPHSSARDEDRAVAVAAGLHHRDHAAGPGARAQQLEVAPQRREVDLRPGRPPLPHAHARKVAHGLTRTERLFTVDP